VVSLTHCRNLVVCMKHRPGGLHSLGCPATEPTKPQCTLLTRYSRRCSEEQVTAPAALAICGNQISAQDAKSAHAQNLLSMMQTAACEFRNIDLDQPGSLTDQSPVAFKVPLLPAVAPRYLWLLRRRAGRANVISAAHAVSSFGVDRRPGPEDVLAHGSCVGDSRPHPLRNQVPLKLRHRAHNMK
jgi:hypothetical protein